jgi:hypothetical protein
MRVKSGKSHIENIGYFVGYTEVSLSKGRAGWFWSLRESITCSVVCVVVLKSIMGMLDGASGCKVTEKKEG